MTDMLRLADVLSASERAFSPHFRETARTAMAYRSLIQAILTDGTTTAEAYGRGGWLPSGLADPYPSDVELRRGASRARGPRRDPFAVSNVEHNGAFLGNASWNLAFRAHHDAVHVADGAEAFDVHGEAYAALAACFRLGLRLDSDAACVLFWEIMGQTAYFDAHGRFPLIDGKQPHILVNDENVWLADCYLRGIRDAVGRQGKTRNPYNVRKMHVWSDK